MTAHDAIKAVVSPMRRAMVDFDRNDVRAALGGAFAPEAVVHLCHPFGDLTGPEHLYDVAYDPLFGAIPDLERRDYIVISGQADRADWVGCAGYYTGTFRAPWLDIPPTGHQVSMRFHEFYRIEDGRVAELQAIWDIPEVMMQASAWPMAPSLGREWLVPGPATQDGLRQSGNDPAHNETSRRLVLEMLSGLSNFADGGVPAMRLADYWHPRCNWYGPAAIGTCRGIEGFRNWHQIPFLNAMPDRGSTEAGSECFAEGDFVAVTGWPNMRMTVTGDGWMGIAPSGRKITMRSLDFWRLERGLIRENWVLVDLLHVYRQLGVDVFARLREFNKARNTSAVSRSGREDF
jgi:predicted ester cyclase